MIEKDRLADLARIAALMRDRDLACLGAAAKAKTATEGLLAALNTPGSDVGLTPQVQANAEARFSSWVAARRIRLNQQLARDTAAWLNARDAARTSFGRADVLARRAAQDAKGRRDQPS